MQRKILLVVAATFSLVAVSSCAVLAQKPSVAHNLRGEERSFHVIPSGNGHGFLLYDTQKARLTGFLDHPYRYLAASNSKKLTNPERRNLLESFSIRVAGVALDEASQTNAGYLNESNIIEADFARGDTRVQAQYYEPFGLEKNAMLTLVHAESRTGSLLGAHGEMALRFHQGGHAISKNMWESTLDILKLPGERIHVARGAKGDLPAWIETGQTPGALIYIPIMAQPGHAPKPRCKTEGKGVPLRESVARQLSGAELLCSGGEVELIFDVSLDQTGSFGMLVLYEEDLRLVQEDLRIAREWVGKRNPETILAASLDEFEHWRVRPKVAFQTVDEERAWRQSETVLRMGQIREPNLHTRERRRVNHGMMLASLPPGNWPIGWVRDGAYAVAALARIGHFEEAKKALNFFLNAEPAGKYAEFTQSKDYRISVTRYFGNGEEECGGPDGKPNAELDGWGLVLWAARQYVQESGDLKWLAEETRLGSVYDALREGIARPIEENLEAPPHPRIMRADSSIWEVDHTDKKHFAYTTITAARGTCDFAAIARKAGRMEDHRRFSSLSLEIRHGYLQSFLSGDRALGALERSRQTDLDGAVAEALAMEVLPSLRSSEAQKVLAHLEKLRLPTGGFARNGGDDWYDVNEWGLVDFRLASAYFKIGDVPKGQALIDRVVIRGAKNFHLVPEMYVAYDSVGRIGQYFGAIPMVGYGAGAYVLALLDRDGKLGGNDCWSAN